MTTVNVQSQISLDELYHGVEQLNQTDLEKFVNRVMRLQIKSRTPSLSKKESDLLLIINQGIAPHLWPLYKELKEKRRTDTLTPAEQEELISMSNQIEEANGQRIQALVDLAMLRDVSLDAIMQDLGIAPATHE